MPDDYWAAVDVRTELLSSGVLTKTAQAEQIKEAVEALTGRSRVRPQHQACKVAAPSLNPTAPALGHYAIGPEWLVSETWLWLGLGWFWGEDFTDAQERTRHVYDFRVVRKRDESTRGMKLLLHLYGTDEQAGFGAWVLLGAVIAPPQDVPVADPTPRVMSGSGRLVSPLFKIPIVRLDDFVLVILAHIQYTHSTVPRYNTGTGWFRLNAQNCVPD